MLIYTYITPKCEEVRTPICESCGVLQVGTLGSHCKSGFLEEVLPVWTRGFCCKQKLLGMAVRPDSLGTGIRRGCRNIAFLHSWEML